MTASRAHTPDAPSGDETAPAPDASRVITLGCRLNTYESEVMEQHLKRAGAVNTIVINTCAVTNEAERQARQTIRRTRRENPDATLVVTGCAAQVHPDAFAAMKEVDKVIGNSEKMHASTWQGLGQADAKVQVADIMTVRETATHLIDGYSDRARAHVQVQQGCDHRCTFCIIPYGRGNARSVPVGEVVEQVRRLTANGYAEVVLTGVDLTSWGPDLPGTPKLGRLVQAILDGVPNLPRLRLSSIDAIEIDARLERLICEDPRVMPHLHLSLQAGDDLILKRMKRRHLRADAVNLVSRLKAKRPDIAIGADLIAGFPTETEAMFENSLKLIDDCQIAYAHIFPFSPRKGTPAARMPQLDRAIIKDRAARLREEGEAALVRHLSAHVGMTHTVLIERGGMGRLEDFSPIRLAVGAARPGALVKARVTGHDGRELIGEVA